MTGAFENWYKRLEPAILIKVEDFHILGYREIKMSHIWSFLTEVKWRNVSPPSLHEGINDIMQMNIGQLMQFITTPSKKQVKQSLLDETLVQEVLKSDAD
ncbi:post-transcriptional regulator [Listeria sp. PSOL-1]|uniref:post-transcriptional regulator n=1 Tax=Listeria sp. PSOL-1 TaxID=1844999 RepID=UPI0013D50BA9|nr:post-transcriptional regulator [Listeria sp. PSOL-1]